MRSSSFLWLAPISGLLLACRPFAVLGRISFVIVNPLKAISLRRLAAHVSQKRFVILLPRSTDANSPAAIAWEPLVSWIKAPLFHRSPAIVFRRSIIVVRCVPSNQRVSKQASAAFDAAKPNAINCYHFHCPTITQAQNTQPRPAILASPALAATRFRSLEHDESPEAFSDYLFGGNYTRSLGHGLSPCPWLEPLGRLHVSAARLLWGK